VAHLETECVGSPIFEYAHARQKLSLYRSEQVLHNSVAHSEGHVSNDGCCHRDTACVSSADAANGAANGAANMEDREHRRLSNSLDDGMWCGRQPAGSVHGQQDETASRRANMDCRVNEQIGNGEEVIKLLLLPGSRLQEVP
jgi:hypothetical protein